MSWRGLSSDPQWLPERLEQAVLTELGKGTPMTASELGERTSGRPSQQDDRVNAALGRLKRRGLVKQVPEGDRKSRLRWTLASDDRVHPPQERAQGKRAGWNKLSISQRVERLKAERPSRAAADRAFVERIRAREAAELERISAELRKARIEAQERTG